MDRREMLVGTAGLMASLAGCGGDDTDGETTPAADTPADAQPGTAAGGDGGGSTTDGEPTATQNQSASAVVGQVVSGNQLSMVVREVSRTSQLGEYQQADPGNEFVVVRLAVKNTTQDQFINFSGFLQTAVQDSEGYSYTQTLATTGQSLNGGQLAPGEVDRGDIVYEVPADATGLTLQFDFRAFSAFQFDRVTVDLTTQETPRADLSQTLRVEVYQPGTSITYGSTQVAVNSVEFVDQLSEFAQPDPGNEFAIVDITTTNQGTESKRISTALQMLVKDGTGASYAMDFAAQGQLDRAYNESSALGPGETRRGQLAYEVPADVSPLYWVFEFTLWTDGDKTFWQVR